jgi:DNA uptake protein ComE-like DNA-binding protein
MDPARSTPNQERNVMKRFKGGSIALTISALVIGGCTVSKEKTDTAAAVDTTAAVAPVAPAPVTPTPAPAPAASGATATSGSTSSTMSDTASGIKKIDLNTATDAEILAIPGMGPRMLREFKEYRPYTSMDQFRREIGKYVDKAEVARFEKYVYIK